ncbi:unannotated protein [freshwater metagenome]|uniref:Unannotated protein n=1 Tax=freshwater metagenome TaxID=449393 RepID=A0A6J6YZ46_9ZZZZ
MAVDAHRVEHLGDTLHGLTNADEQVLGTLHERVEQPDSDPILRSGRDTEEALHLVGDAGVLLQDRLRRHRDAVTQDDDGERRARRCGGEDVAHAVSVTHRLAVDRHHQIARQQPGLGGGRIGHDACQMHIVRVLHPTGECVDGHDDRERDDQVHDRTGGDHPHPPGVGALTVRLPLVLGGHLVDVGHADDLHEAAERDCPHAVLDAIAVNAPHPRAEPEEELSGLHPAAAGSPEVAQLVQHDRHCQSEHEHQHPRVRPTEEREQRHPGQRSDDHRRGFGLLWHDGGLRAPRDDLLFELQQTHLGSTSWATTRARASAATMSSTVESALGS